MRLKFWSNPVREFETYFSDQNAPPGEIAERRRKLRNLMKELLGTERTSEFSRDSAETSMSMLRAYAASMADASEIRDARRLMEKRIASRYSGPDGNLTDKGRQYIQIIGKLFDAAVALK